MEQHKTNENAAYLAEMAYRQSIVLGKIKEQLEESNKTLTKCYRLFACLVILFVVVPGILFILGMLARSF